MKLSVDVLKRLEDAFSPSAPIKSQEFFLGRLDQLDDVIDGINERGQHIVVYGERGVGKTSFANIVGTRLVNVFPVKVTCNRTDGFKALWDKAFKKVQFERTSTGMGFMPIDRQESLQLDLFLPDKDDITSLDVQFVLEKINSNLLFIFDEYDSVQGKETARQMADTMKALSDNAPHVSIMLVGVGATVTDLIGEHESLERCLCQVKMPRMSLKELHGILDKGLQHLGLTMRPSVGRDVVRFAQGFPHFAHLLGKQSCRAALEDEQTDIIPAHLSRAITSSIARVDESVRHQYQRATMTPKQTSKFEAVLWACAFADEDAHGTFRGRDVKEKYRMITSRETTVEQLAYYLGKLCTDQRGELLEKFGRGRVIRYRFRNPLVRAYSRLKREAAQVAPLSP